MLSCRKSDIDMGNLWFQQNVVVDVWMNFCFSERWWWLLFFFCVNLLYLAIIDMLCKKIKSAFLGQLWVFSGYGRSKYNAYKLCFIMYTKNGYNN